ncbi:MAG: helix-turn-helix domain-containing protein [Melioribacteraceae bacterium]
MSLENQLLFFLSTLGAFNGILLSLYFIFFIKQKRLSNILFGVLLLTLSIRIGKSVVYHFNHDLLKIYLQIGLSACFLIGPSLYFYLSSAVKQIDKISRGWKLHISLLLLVVIVVGFMYPYQEFPLFWNRYFVKAIYTVWIGYIILSGFVIRNIFFSLFSKKDIISLVDKWLLGVYIGNVIVALAFTSSFISSSAPYISAPILFSFAFYLLVFFLVFQKNRDVIFSEPQQKYSNKKISEEEASLLLNKLNQVMNEKELYKNPYLKLNDVAKELNILGHRLSQLLNDNLGKSFSSFVNEYRIEEAKKLLNSNDHYTLEAIGFDAGFSSKSAFYSTFKKFTNTTPAGYKKNLV